MTEDTVFSIEYMLNDVSSLVTQGRKVHLLKKITRENQQALNILQDKHKYLRKFTKHVALQGVPSVGEFVHQFKQDLKSYERQSFFIFRISYFRNKFFDDSVLSWLIDSVIGVYSVYSQHDIHLDDRYYTEIEKSVNALSKKLVENSKTHRIKNDVELFDFVKPEFEKLFISLSVFSRNVDNQLNQINAYLDKLSTMQYNEVMHRQ